MAQSLGITHLDCAAGVPPLPELAAEYPVLTQRFGLNPHGLTCYAEEGRRALLDAERRLLSLCGATCAEAGVVWCATGTEAANLALRGFPWKHADAPLAIDLGAHPAMRETARALRGHPLQGFLVQPDGSLKFHASSTLPPPALAALSLVNNETGVIWNGDRTALPHDCAVALDACQAFGKHPLPWKASDLLILSSRKLGGPATGAALVYRKSLRLNPIITGGGQQDGLRSGTLDTASILLFVKAAELACAQREHAWTAVSKLNRMLREGIARLGKGAWPIFSPETASPYICYFAIPGYEGAIVARALAEKYHIIIGTGSACSAESRHTSPLLHEMGVTDGLARSALRVSFSSHTTPDELERLLDALPEILADY